MTTVYKVFHPYTGLHVDANNVEELKQCLMQVAWESYMKLTNGINYAIVTINPDGSQVWRSPTGENMVSPSMNPEDHRFTLPLLITNPGE